MNPDKVLIICGPTATGKTSLGLYLAQKYRGEIVSADSRQVYSGLDIVTGKDLPHGAKAHVSTLKWRDRFLSYYLIDGVKVWLYDIVSPLEPFNVAFWRECVDIVISDIQFRDGLPIVVGGSGLYLKSLTETLSHISISPNQGLRRQLSARTPLSLFNYLKRIDSFRAASLNQSDRRNPRRLIRAIEIALSPPAASSVQFPAYPSFSLGLTAPLQLLYQRVDDRIASRLQAGAQEEAMRVSQTFGAGLPALSACGYSALLTPGPVSAWTAAEHTYVRRQLTWFKKQPLIHWFDISASGWQSRAEELVTKWYN